MLLDDETLEFSQARLRLNTSLRFTLRVVGSNETYFVEDDITGRFFRLGVPQYTFLSMLDGQRTVSTALMKTATLLREHAIDEQEAASLCKWGIESGLIESENGNSAQRRIEQHERDRARKLVSWANPLMLRVTLFNPQRIVDYLHRYLGFLVSTTGALIWLAVVVYGFLQLAPELGHFYSRQIVSIGADDLGWIAVAWLLLKIAHEAAHATVCRRFGGRTHECGVLLLMLIPMPFVDLTSSWRFRNKWRRILTSAAGMILEIFIAAIACIVWTRSQPGPLQYHTGNLIISATLVTVLFNMNPLMRFDGYYILSDLIEIPNLSSHGRQWLAGVFGRIFLGVKSSPLKETGYRGIFVRVYGVLSLFWSASIIIGLSFAAYSLIDGFGLLIALLSCVLWLVIPLFRLAVYLCKGDQVRKPNRVRFACAMTLMVASVAGFFFLCPSPSVVSAPFVIDYTPHSIVRSRTPGFVQQVHVAAGERVTKGQPLLTLHNPELKHKLRSLLIDMDISRLKISSFLAQDEVSQMQLEEESLVSMTKREAELRKHIDDLEIRAPQDGDVMAVDMDSLLGRWCEPGRELLSIGSRDDLAATALATQADIPWLDGERPEADLLVWGRHENEVIRGRISLIAPRARDDVPHEAFTASAGGPLAVVSRRQVEGASAEGVSSRDLMLCDPRVRLEITLSQKDRSTLAAGQSGLMLIRSRNENMWKFVTRKIRRLAREETTRTHGI